MELTLFDNPQLHKELLLAYFDARKHKRNTINAIRFELNLEHNIWELYREIAVGRYRISPSICFIVDKPVKREIFAAHFRDRVVHHYIINSLLPIFENQFIYDSYSCRIGKGTLFGIERMEHFITCCSQNFTKEAFILKLDIQGFFMNINKELLWKKISNLIDRKYKGDNVFIIKELACKTIFDNPTGHCIIKGKKADWNGLPASKSLFSAKEGCGLPIGNITSQIFANYYLTEFDRFIKEDLKIKYYGRYVDDFIIIHNDRKYLSSLIPILAEFLDEKLHLTLHPKKIYLQPVLYGVTYLGAKIQPYRKYLTARCKGNFSESVRRMLADYPSADDFHYLSEQKAVESTLNSYTGMCKHFKENKRCRDALEKLPLSYYQYFEVDQQFQKIVARKAPPCS